MRISTHALLAEGDVELYVGDVAARISTHALLAEGDEHVLRHAAGHVRISTHALLAEGDYSCQIISSACDLFQPTPSLRRATLPFISRPRSAKFQPTPSLRRATLP